MQRPDSDPDDPAHTFLFKLDDGSVIDGNIRGNTARWINHSCDPNCKPYEYGDVVYASLALQSTAADDLRFD